MSKANGFDAMKFIDEQTIQVQKILGHERALIACSGGVDSTTCAVLTRRAVGENLDCIFIDTNFMRMGEPEQVVERLRNPPIGLPVRLVRANTEFMEALKGLRDAEEKRKAFRRTFYSVLSRASKEEHCSYLVQGTILPDILETVGGIKTQHNVLEQMKINTKQEFGFIVVEPLVSLYKYQVREVARALGIPEESSERQPFPGPGLSVRVVGEVTPEKLDIEKKVTDVVERLLEPVNSKQYFSATIDSMLQRYPKASDTRNEVHSLLRKQASDVDVASLRARATGIRGGKRLYGRVVLVRVRDEKGKCLRLPYRTMQMVQATITSIDRTAARILYSLSDKPREGSLIVAVRAIESKDFVRARVTNVPWKILRSIESEVMASCPTVSSVYFDITPKPPGSIEFE
ncbi:GMP synthase [Candidatus Bathyarchaeota archaeon]|nr:GMP synthase [Candidatus Bathyarchaeota archaeon]